MTASVNATINVQSSAATSVAVTALGPFTAPVAAGTPVANISCQPSIWAGTLALSGTNAALFAIGPGVGGLVGQIIVGSNPVEAGSFTVTVTANP